MVKQKKGKDSHKKNSEIIEMKDLLHKKPFRGATLTKKQTKKCLSITIESPSQKILQAHITNIKETETIYEKMRKIE